MVPYLFAMKHLSRVNKEKARQCGYCHCSCSSCNCYIYRAI